MKLARMIEISGGYSGVGAALNAADVEPGSTVAIFGLGTIGLAVSNLCLKISTVYVLLY